MKNDLKTRSYYLSVQTIKLIEEITSERKIYHSMVDQLIRSTTSIGANVVEAKSASSRRDFIKFYEISLKSANETKYWLCLFRDALNCEKEKIAQLLKEADEISKMIASSILTLKGKKQI